MLRWLGGIRKPPEPPDRPIKDGNVTDDPLAAIAGGRLDAAHIYSVSRSVLLPRVTLFKHATDQGEGINPLFLDANENPTTTPKNIHPLSPHSNSSPSREKSSSSGYGGSHGEPPYHEHMKLIEDVGALLEQNPAFVKSIRISTCGPKSNKQVPSHSSSSGTGTLTTIPEGKVDFPIPKPIWPLHDKRLLDHYDSLVDDTLLFYTSLSRDQELSKSQDNQFESSVKDLLLELLNGINETLEGKNGTPPEDMLKILDEKIRRKLEVLRHSTEDEMKKLCVNLSNCRKNNPVLRALSNSSSGNSSRSWGSTGGEDIYQVPSSSSGFSEKDPPSPNGVPPPRMPAPPPPDYPFLDDPTPEELLLRNAMIYATLCRGRTHCGGVYGGGKKSSTFPKKSLLRAVNDGRPSVWEQYYGMRPTGLIGKAAQYVGKPTDVPLFPLGRPEADFTLDMPRSEHLLKRMKKDKKWRCRCRLLTTFLGLIFFLLSVMAVSLMLTRGKRMFGSMV